MAYYFKTEAASVLKTIQLAEVLLYFRVAMLSDIIVSLLICSIFSVKTSA